MLARFSVVACTAMCGVMAAAVGTQSDVRDFGAAIHAKPKRGVFARVPEVELPLEQGFLDPPKTNRPQVWWWFDATAPDAAITRDLEGLKRVGISGFHIYGGSVTEKGWLPRAKWALHEANRLGCTVCRDRVKREGEGERTGSARDEPLAESAHLRRGPAGGRAPHAHEHQPLQAGRSPVAVWLAGPSPGRERGFIIKGQRYFLLFKFALHFLTSLW